jgi:hypothetical protein
MGRLMSKNLPELRSQSNLIDSEGQEILVHIFYFQIQGLANARQAFYH